MSERFEIGGQCVCIIGGVWRNNMESARVSPIKGQIYTIAHIQEFLGLAVLGLVLPSLDKDTLFSSAGFRPCKKTDISVLEKLLKEKPCDVKNATERV